MPRHSTTEETLQSFNNNIIAEAVQKVISIELETHSYASAQNKNNRKRLLYKSYSALLSDKDMTIFEPEELAAFLLHRSVAECMRMLSLVIYLLEKNFISNSKLSRLLDFKSHFLKQNEFIYNDFIYLMKSDIFDEFTADKGIMNETYADKLFFSSCDILHDEEITMLTHKWCEGVKLDTIHTVSSRLNLLHIYHSIAKDLFKSRGIDDLKREDLINTNQYKALFLYLEFINKHHPLSDNISYLCTFSDVFQNGRRELYNFSDLCLADDPLKYVSVHTVKGNRLFCIDIPTSTSLFQDMIDYISMSPYRTRAFTDFVNTFYESMGPFKASEAGELSLNAFIESVGYYGRKENPKKFFSILHAFYNFLYNKYQINFFESSGLDASILSINGLPAKINSGYKIVKYNAFDEVPESDKWIVFYNPKADTSTIQHPSKAITMDFSNTENEYFKSWIKQFVWRAEKSLLKKREEANVLREALNYVNDIRTHKVLSIYCRETVSSNAPLTSSEISAIRDFFRNQDTAEKTKHSKIYAFTSFLHFLEDNDVTSIPNGAFYHLYYQDSISNTARAIPDDELICLTRVIKQNAKETITNALYSIAYAISLDTSLRISSIFSLKIDCIHETAKKGEYTLSVRQKDPTLEYTEEPITISTKRYIDQVIEITKELRKKAPKYLKDVLFIVPQRGSAPVRKLNRNNFTIYLKKCCQCAGIPTYTAANLRDTYMTKAKEFQIKNQLSDAELSILTGHKTSDVDVKHYLDMDITTIMEAVNGVIVGDVNIHGAIVPKIPSGVAIDENEVSNGCGYCQNSVCNELTYIDCIMCKHFITTPSRLPFFENQIKQMNMNIKNAITPHDKEDYINIKRLLVAYEAKMKDLVIR